MGFLGWEEEDIYTTSCTVCPLFNTNERYVKKSMVYLALSKLKNELESPDFVKLSTTRGYNQLNRFYRKGKKKFTDHLPDVVITGMAFDDDKLKNVLNRIAGEQVKIKTISLQRPSGKVYGKYCLEKELGYDSDTDILSKNGNYYKFKTYTEDLNAGTFTVTLISIGEYIKQDLEYYRVEAENIKKGSTTITGQKEEDVTYTYQAITHYETRPVKAGNTYDIIYHNTETGEIYYDEDGEIQIIKFRPREDGEYDFPVIGTKTGTRKEWVDVTITVPAVEYTEVTYVSNCFVYLRGDNRKQFYASDLSQESKDSSKDKTKYLTYRSDDIDDDIEYTTDYDTYEEAYNAAKNIQNNFSSESSKVKVKRSTTYELPSSTITKTYDIPLENYYFVDYSTSKKGTNYFFCSMDDAESYGLTRDPISEWKNDTKGTLDALPIVLLRHGKENLNKLADKTEDINEVLTVERYKSTKKLLKSCGIKLDELTKSLREDSEGNQVVDDETYGRMTEIYFNFGVRFIDDWTIKDGTTVIPEAPRGISKYLYTLFNAINTKFPSFKDFKGRARVCLEFHELRNVYHGAFHNKIFWDVSEDKLVEGNVKSMFNDPRIKRNVNKGFTAHKIVNKRYVTHHFRYWHLKVELDRSVSVHPNGFIEWEDVEEVFELPDKTLYSRNTIGSGRVDMPYGKNWSDFVYQQGLLTGKVKSDMDLRKVDDPYNKIIYTGNSSDKPSGANPIESNFCPITCTVIEQENGIPKYEVDYDFSHGTPQLENYYSVYYNNYERYEKQEIAFDKKWVLVNPTAESGSSDYLKHRLTEEEANGDYNGDGSYYTKTRKVQSVYIYHQYDKNHVHILQLDNVWAYKVVYRPDGADEHFQNAKDESCYIPLLWFPVKKLNMKEKMSLYHRSTFLQIHAVQHDHLEWYESESFNLFIGGIIRVASYIIAAVIFVCTWGTGVKLSAATVFWGSVFAVATSAVASGLMQMGNTTLAIVFTVAMAVFTLGRSIGDGITSLINSTSSIFTTACTIIQTVADISQIMAGSISKDLQKEMKELEGEIKDRQESINEAQALITSSNIIDPMEMLAMNTKDPVPMSPTTFINIAIGGGTDYDFLVGKYADRTVSNFVDNCIKPSNVD